MAWATNYIAKLKAGQTVSLRPRGNSMTGKISSGQLVTIEPATVKEVDKGDIVLCKVNGNQYIHLVNAKQGDRVQIANNFGHINGWTKQVFGKVIKIEP